MRIVRPTPNVLEIKTPIYGEEIHVREVKKFGNGAKIDFAKNLIGKKVIVVVLK
jgi:putative transposon-encoded protein